VAPPPGKLTSLPQISQLDLRGHLEAEERKGKERKGGKKKERKKMGENTPFLK